MGGGDLNMKKSWHPLLIKNQERVWKEEQKASEEQKKLDQLKKEKEEERQWQELRRLQEEAGGKKGTERLEWMYAAGPNQSSSGRAQEMEDFLLGKKRVDSLVSQGNSLSQLSTESTDIFLSAINPNANTYRDTQSKIREDPLLMIKKMEQNNIKAIVTNPIKMKELKEKSKKENHEKKHKKMKNEKMEFSPKDEINRVRNKSPYKSKPERKRSASPINRIGKRRRDDFGDRSNHRDANNYQRNSVSRLKKHELFTNEYEERDSYDKQRRSNYGRNRYSSTSLSPRRRERYPHTQMYDKHRSPFVSPHNLQRSRNREEEDSKKTIKDEAQKRLQAMMNDAVRLDNERKARVAELARVEKEEEKRFEEQMAKMKENGGHSGHLRKLYKEAISSPQALDLGGQVRKARNMLQRDAGEV
ncbi:hypothetical protein G9A89_010314 [Geosiphon pyriformis]|nr:hypothetical protein G9A89_010314 [Geosiphon pyriformis]